MKDKFKLNYKKGAIIQFVLIFLVAVTLLLISLSANIAIDAVMFNDVDVLDYGMIGIMFLLPVKALGVIGIGLVEIFCLILGAPCLLLSIVALILNLYKPSLKKWKVARVLNFLCLIIICFCLYVMFENIVITFILLLIIIINIYLMYFSENIKKSIKTIQNQKSNISN